MHTQVLLQYVHAECMVLADAIDLCTRRYLDLLSKYKGLIGDAL